MGSCLFYHVEKERGAWYYLIRIGEMVQMGVADIVTAEYMSDNAVFADAFNFLMFNGEEEIKMCDAMKQIIAEENAIAANAAVLQNNIRFVLKGKISVEDAAEACNLSVDDFLKKKEEYEKTKH